MGIRFLFPFLYLLYSEYHVVHADPYFWHTWCVFSKQDARGNLVQELVLAFFSCSAFCQRFLMQTSIRQSQIMPFLLTQNFWTDIFLHDISLHSVYAAQFGKGIPKGFPNSQIKLIVACLMTASGWLLRCSLHLIAFQMVPSTSFHLIVRTFLARKSFAAGSSTDLCHLARFLKSVPRNVIPSISCSTQLPRSTVGVTHVSWDWLLIVPFLQSSCSSGFLRLFSCDDESERSLLVETLEGTLRGTPQVTW